MKMSKLLEDVVQGRTQLSKSAAEVVVGLGVELFIFIIDRSWSMDEACGRGNRLKAAQEAAVGLLRARRESGANDQVAVIAFNDSAQVVLPPVRCQDQFKRIERALRSLHPRGGTDLQAPLMLAEQYLSSDCPIHIVVLTDGHGGNPLRIAKSLRDRGAIIETVGVGNSPSEVDEAVLQKMASVLNGQVLYRFLSDFDSLVQYFRTDVAFRLSKRPKP